MKELGIILVFCSIFTSVFVGLYIINIYLCNIFLKNNSDIPLLAILLYLPEIFIIGVILLYI